MYISAIKRADKQARSARPVWTLVKIEKMMKQEQQINITETKDLQRSSTTMTRYLTKDRMSIWIHKGEGTQAYQNLSKNWKLPKNNTNVNQINI